MKNIHHDSSHERFSESFMTSTLKVCFENRNLLYRNQTQLDPVSAFLIFRLQMSIGGKQSQKGQRELKRRSPVSTVQSKHPICSTVKTPQMQHSGNTYNETPKMQYSEAPKMQYSEAPKMQYSETPLDAFTEKHPRYNTVKLKRRSLVSCNKVKTPDAVQ